MIILKGTGEECSAAHAILTGKTVSIIRDLPTCWLAVDASHASIASIICTTPAHAKEMEDGCVSAVQSTDITDMARQIVGARQALTELKACTARPRDRQPNRANNKYLTINTHDAPAWLGAILGFHTDVVRSLIVTDTSIFWNDMPDTADFDMTWVEGEIKLSVAENNHVTD